MTTKKTPREIAEKAVAFANRTDVVRDGYEMPIVLPNVVTYIHNNPKIDHGTYRSYIAAFGYATGYQDAQNEQPPIAIDLPSVDEIRSLLSDLDSDHTKAVGVHEFFRLRFGTGQGLPKPVADRVGLRDIPPVVDEFGDGFRDGLKSCAKELEKAIEQANIGIVIKPPPPPPPPAAPMPKAPDELIAEIDDELAKAAAEYANAEFDCAAWSWDLETVRQSASLTISKLRERAKKVVVGEWAFLTRGFVAGAHWQLAMVERAMAGEETTAREYEQRIDDLQKENARLQEIASKDADLHVMLRNYALPTEAKAFAQEYESRRDGWLFVPKDQKQAFAPAPEPVIVFDNDEEREYWSAVSLDRNHWNGDEGPEAIGAYADRMVQVRRARMPTKVELPLEGYRLLFAVGAELAMLGAPAFQIQPRTANFVITFFFHYEIHEFGTKDFRGNTPGEIAADLISRVK
jgi:hypothetical protein